MPEPIARNTRRMISTAPGDADRYGTVQAGNNPTLLEGPIGLANRQRARSRDKRAWRIVIRRQRRGRESPCLATPCILDEPVPQFKSALKIRRVRRIRSKGNGSVLNSSRQSRGLTDLALASCEGHAACHLGVADGHYVVGKYQLGRRSQSGHRRPVA
jgi:hypothetical protein